MDLWSAVGLSPSRLRTKIMFFRIPGQTDKREFCRLVQIAKIGLGKSCLQHMRPRAEYNEGRIRSLIGVSKYTSNFE
jgi:hypothetical protein